MPARLAAILLVAAATVISASQTAQPNALTAAERTDGWRLLFDGKTLNGWRSYDPSKNAVKGWTIDNGCLKNMKSNGTPNSGGGDIVTLDQFVDFDVRFDWRISPGGNSGVKYLVHERLNAAGAPMWEGDDGRSAVGHEYQIIDDEHHAEAPLAPDVQTGALYSLIAPSSARKVRPIGQFNESRIIVKGTHVEHWLNGAKIVDYELGSPSLLKAVAASKFKPVPGFGTKFKTRILLQDHGDEVWFRNLKIRAL